MEQLTDQRNGIYIAKRDLEFWVEAIAKHIVVVSLFLKMSIFFWSCIFSEQRKNFVRMPCRILDKLSGSSSTYNHPLGHKYLQVAFRDIQAPDLVFGFHEALLCFLEVDDVPNGGEILGEDPSISEKSQ